MIARKLKLHDILHPDGGPTIWLPENDCAFCSHCTDIFWDYSHGIYARFCELHETPKNGCTDFNEDIKEV